VIVADDLIDSMPPAPQAAWRRPVPNAAWIVPALCTLWLLIVAVLTLPQPGPTVGGVGLDPSWQAALGVALREHLQWGSQIVWTYGPYGYLDVFQTLVDCRSWTVALGVNLAVHFALVGVLALFLVQAGARPWQWLLAGAIMLLPNWHIAPQMEFEAVIAVALLLHMAAAGRLPAIAHVLAGSAGAVIGFLLLAKGTSLLEGGALVAAFALLRLVSGQRGAVLSLLGGAFASFLCLWLLSGQSPADIVPYLRTSYEVAAGYSAGASLVDVHNHYLQAGIAAVMVVLTALLALLALRRRNLPVFGLLLLSLPILLVSFKEGVVRFGEARIEAFWSVAAVLLGLALVRTIASARGWRRSGPLAAPLAAVVLACVVLMSGLGNAIGGVSGDTPWPTRTFPARMAAYRHAAGLIVRPDRRLQEEARNWDEIRSAYRMPPAVVDDLRRGDVDVVPWDQDLLFAYGLHWNPRPVLQSYIADRPLLDHLDAEHFRGAHAPRFVVFVWEDIDGRYPLFSEPEMYRALLERYEVRTLTPAFLVLERRPAASPVTTREMGASSGPLGGWLQVPRYPNRPVYARVEVPYTLLGQALDRFFQPPQLHIRLRYAGGQVSPPWRFIPALGPDGLALSTYTADLSGVARQAEGKFDLPVEAFQIEADSPATAYVDTVRVSYFTT
jgi:hypothetical protein